MLELPYGCHPNLLLLLTVKPAGAARTATASPTSLKALLTSQGQHVGHSRDVVHGLDAPPMSS